jgi:TonB family protein
MRPATVLHTAEVLPPRAVLFLGIVAVHALLAYYLGNGLIRQVKDFIDPIRIIDIKDDPVPVPQPRDPDLNPTMDNRYFVPPDEPTGPVYSETDTITTTSVLPPTGEPIGGTAVVVEPPPIRLVGRNVIPNSESYYPAQERRLGREGTAEVQACVSEKGVLSSTPTVQHSSGRASFDQAAVRLVGDGRFARAMRGDEAVPNCYRFRVSFTMQGG